MATFIMALLLSTLAGTVHFGTVQAESSITKPSVPEFTVKLIDSSYDVPTTYSIDPYTGENVTHTGYHVESRTIEVRIKNQPFVAYQIQDNSSDTNWTVHFYYNIRVKGHFSEDWNELYNPEGYLSQDSGSEYTVISYVSGENAYAIDTGSKRIEFPPNAQVDFQVEALIGYSHRVIEGAFAPWRFTGETSGWSETRTITIPTSTLSSPTPTPPNYGPTPSPDQEPQQTELLEIILAVASIVTVIGVALLVYFKKRNHVGNTNRVK